MTLQAVGRLYTAACIWCYTRSCSFPKHTREVSANQGSWFVVVTQGLSTKKKKNTCFADPKATEMNVSMSFCTPPKHSSECAYVRVRTCTLGKEEREKRKRVLTCRKKVLFPVYFWKMFVSACPHVFHGKDLGGDQSMGWICVPGGCPYHGLQARISRRIPAATALNPETTCPGYTNTSSVFHLDQLFLLPNSPACSNGGPKRLGSEQAVVFQNKGPHLKHKICSRETWKLSTGVPESGKGGTFDTKPLTQKYFLLLKSEEK